MKNKQVGLLRRKSKAFQTWPLHLMLLPAVILVFVYSYIPMAGLVMAFQKYNIFLGKDAMFLSEWVGFQNYIDLWNMGEPARVIFNTVKIAFLKLSIGFFVPIIVSILLNEITKNWFKRTIQTVIYMPHFLSWVLLAGIVRQLFSAEGAVNTQLLPMLGLDPIPFLTSNNCFVPLLVATDIWKGFGFGTVIYLAAITSIDPTLYEAAEMDGANRFKRIWHVTLPGMVPIIVLQLILSLQNVLNAGFDQIFNLYNPQVYPSADIIDTWVYRTSFMSQTPSYELSTAVGLFKSVVSLIFIATSYWAANKYAGYEIF